MTNEEDKGRLSPPHGAGSQSGLSLGFLVFRLPEGTSKSSWEIELRGQFILEQTKIFKAMHLFSNLHILQELFDDHTYTDRTIK